MNDSEIIRDAFGEGNVEVLEKYYEFNPMLVNDVLEFIDYINPSLIDYLLDKDDIFKQKFQYGAATILARTFEDTNQLEVYYEVLNKTNYDRVLMGDAIIAYLNWIQKKPFIRSDIDYREMSSSYSRCLL